MEHMGSLVVVVVLLAFLPWFLDLKSRFLAVIAALQDLEKDDSPEPNASSN